MELDGLGEAEILEEILIEMELLGDCEALELEEMEDDTETEGDKLSDNEGDLEILKLSELEGDCEAEGDLEIERLSDELGD